jgi:enoyl-[acyl-carrier protein] reductase II
MLTTPICELLGIEAPIVQGSFGPWSTPELVAAVSEAGALGTIGTGLQSPGAVTAAIRRVRELTSRPFAVNFTARPFTEESFQATLDDSPGIVSFALGDPGDLVVRAHDVGARFVQQVHPVEQAVRAAESGADVIVAQWMEAGGFGGTVAGLALVPQVVDAVAPLPVLAAGGIADGRGVAAALVLGAAGVQLGTRFLASVEAGVDLNWKKRIVDAASEDAIRIEFAETVFPPSPPGWATAPRVLDTPFVDEWNRRRDDAPERADDLRDELMAALREERAHELVPFTGQTAGLIDEILPVAEIVRGLVTEAGAALRAASMRAG